MVEVREDSAICNKCRQKYYSEIKRQSSYINLNAPSNEEEQSDPTNEPPTKKSKQNITDEDRTTMKNTTSWW